MNPEKVISMCTEGSIEINHIPGGYPEFTTEDARHALAHMNKAEFNYCQYVFLLYENKIDDLVENVVCYIISQHRKNLLDKKQKKGLMFIIRLCTLACSDRMKPADVSNLASYKTLNLTRGEWRWFWQAIYADAVSYLDNLDSRVRYHIYRQTKNSLA